MPQKMSFPYIDYARSKGVSRRSHSFNKTAASIFLVPYGATSMDPSLFTSIGEKVGRSKVGQGSASGEASAEP